MAVSKIGDRPVSRLRAWIGSGADLQRAPVMQQQNSYRLDQPDAAPLPLLGSLPYAASSPIWMSKPVPSPSFVTYSAPRSDPFRYPSFSASAPLFPSATTSSASSAGGTRASSLIPAAANREAGNAQPLQAQAQAQAQVQAQAQAQAQAQYSMFSNAFGAMQLGMQLPPPQLSLPLPQTSALPLPRIHLVPVTFAIAAPTRVSCVSLLVWADAWFRPLHESSWSKLPTITR